MTPRPHHPLAARRSGPGPSQPSSAPAWASRGQAPGDRWPRCFYGRSSPGASTLRPANSHARSAWRALCCPSRLAFRPPPLPLAKAAGTTRASWSSTKWPASGSPCWAARSTGVMRSLLLLLFRLFDITKPFPARQLERLPAGWGIVFDDVAAGLYAWGVAALLRLWI